MRKTSMLLTALVVIGMLAGMIVSTVPSSAINLGGILLGGGIVVLVDQFSGQLDKFINTLTLNSGAATTGKTKVVPIISIGQGTYIGAAQVSGPAEAVQKTAAVAAIEANMSGRTFRIKALVPVQSKNVLKGIKRVQGVGVSAIIDVNI